MAWTMQASLSQYMFMTAFSQISPAVQSAFCDRALSQGPDKKLQVLQTARTEAKKQVGVVPVCGSKDLGDT